MKVDILKIEKIIPGYPAAWSVKLEGGRLVYVSYRYGCLTITISAHATDDISKCELEIYTWYSEKDGDGEMDTEDMLPYLLTALENLTIERDAPVNYPLPILKADGDVIEGYILLYNKIDQDGDIFNADIIEPVEDKDYPNLPVIQDVDWQTHMGQLVKLVSDEIGLYAVIKLIVPIDIKKYGLSVWFTRKIVDQKIMVAIKGIGLRHYES